MIERGAGWPLMGSLMLQPPDREGGREGGEELMGIKLFFEVWNQRVTVFLCGWDYTRTECVLHLMHSYIHLVT